VLVGRVLETKGSIGRAEFTDQARNGDYIYYRLSNNRKAVCQIISLKSTPVMGFHGDFKILDSDELPKSFTCLYLLRQALDAGYFEIGKCKDKIVKLLLNPFFLHTLIAGTTGAGKTHLLIVLAEEFLKHHIPSLFIDTKGNLVNLNRFSPDAVVTEELKFEDFLGYMKHKKLVVYNLQGLSYSVKANRAFEILSELMRAKERDYKNAENDTRLLEILPILVGIDETEIYAPEFDKSAPSTECKETLIDIAKRGREYGLGLILATQRVSQLELEVRSQCNSAFIFHIYDDGSRKVLRALPYISSLELNRVKNCTRGQSLITGQIMEHPIMVDVRDIQTIRAKDVDFEKMVGLQKLVQPEETEEEPSSGTFSAIAKVYRVGDPCPDCGKPLAYDQKYGKVICKSDACTVIECKGAKVIRAAAPARKP